LSRLNILWLLTVLTGFSAAGHLIFEYFGPRVLVYLFKPLTMIWILAIALYGLKENRSFYAWFIGGGLLFSLMGDIFLMLPSDLFFQGLVSFLIGHIFYILAFSKGIKLRVNTLSWLPFLIFGILVFGFMLPSLKEMTIPVLLYILVILTMGWRAFERWKQTKTRGSKFALTGAIFFIISDSALGINRFRLPFDLSAVVVLITYFSAQWCLAWSVVREG
jgi:uncharacterized membrane protein YhhN